MLAHALDASAINVVASIWRVRYCALVSVAQPGVDRQQASVVTAWRAIAATHAAACAALEHELGKRHGLGVSEFEVLDRLTDSRERDYRAQELADAVHLSQSALSRLLDRLEKNGLIERCLCGEDRRGIYVRLTAAGQQRHTEAAPTHRDVLAAVLPASLLGP
jgi:DNA-binding MarR family transcriptional regulator